ncbi:Zn(2)-C6 fungal-type DNA-binding domain protein [Kalmanozyma brasiliensis GHG001]|uniref:Zn(2)-C6 fungal-type domain-containing protein n=1 Tax=Kalmanozyma brasiliensis (strain GHG001) TaxID=1365824 RepID=V5EKD2_KALBG|nr:Zn(2)-C6 fungal-type DNA-binding domain protein [Kalmanozyma brasiliensis GHG001]EST05345.1 Zn(2)-C6 fungal-type DNA-binding domain protein [Kalmanozyma brasiliensis GHG001]
MSSISSGSSSSRASPSSSSTSRSPSAEPSSSSNKRQRRLTLQDIHIPAGFEIAKHLSEAGSADYPSEENIEKAAEVLQSLRGRMPDGSDGQVAACDYCRRRKIRCDRIKPTCGSCVSSGRKCTTEDMLRKRGPPSKKERAILEAAGIIFRGTRPHRRRRTATTSLGSGAASKQHEEMVRKVKEAAGTRTRANSAQTGAAAASATLVDGYDVGSKSSWMEMLSVATQSANPFADSPASSPSDISAQDTFHVDAGACDYVMPIGMAPFPPRTAMDNVNSSVQWDNMWATFGADLRNKYVPGGPTPPLELPNLTAYAINASVDSKDGLFRSPLASFDAGALDWSASNVSPSQYQNMYPHGAPIAPHEQPPLVMPVVHVDPQMMVPLPQPFSHPLHHQQAHEAQQQPFINSPSTMAAEAMAFQSAMGHFFPKRESPALSLHTLSSSSSNVDVSTPTELDQFISMGDPSFPQNQHALAHQQQMSYAMSF